MGRGPPLLRLDVGRSDHLAPLLGFVGNKLAEIGGRTCEHCCAEIGEPRLKVGIGKARIDLRFNVLMISAGVFLGATMPHQALAS